MANSEPWFDSEIIQAIKKRDKLLQKIHKVWTKSQKRQILHLKSNS